MPYVVRPPRLSRIVPVAAAIVASAFATAGPAAAATTDVCVTPSFSQIFLPWKDNALYTKSPGGDFESSMPGWAFGSGSRVVAGNESFHVGGSEDSSSLYLAAGASTVSSPMCIDRTYPLFRFFARNLSGGRGSLQVEVLWQESGAASRTSCTMRARIVQLVREAESRRAPVEEFVKRFARVYTPAVTIMAALVMIGPPLLAGAPALEWFVRGITLLVIACPCALVIATPVTVVSALTSAARNGVLIKGGEHLEALGSLRALAIDKTGTLTTGALRVTDFQTNGAAPDQLLQRITSVEARSEHPIAQAIVRYAEERGIRPGNRVEAFAAVPGRGVRGRVRGVDLVIGTEALVRPQVVQEWGTPEPGALSIYVDAGDGAHGAFTLEDQIRVSATDVVRRLHRLGIRPIVMLTGDAAAAAQVIAEATGVDEVRWRLLPEQKVETVRELRSRFGAVGMLGDGVNDAPALAAANVGLAMGAAGSPATIETADVALMGDDLTKLPYAVRLARQARRTIRFNIGLALGLKLVLAVGAIAGLVSLAVAVLVGDMGGSLAVTGNALRLARLRSAE